MEAIRKITVKEILKGKPETTTIEGTDENGNKVAKKKLVKTGDLMLLFGKAREHDTRQSNYGPFTEYMGQFEGRRLKDGEIFQSTRMILPPPASDIFFNAYMEAKADSPDAVVEFAVVIGVEPSDRGTEGYRFTCRPIQDPSKETVDPLADLRAMLGEQVPELLPPAPKAIGHDPATGEVKEPKAKGKKGEQPGTEGEETSTDQPLNEKEPV